VLEKKVLKRVFGANMDKEMGGWRKPDNEELRELYSPPNISRIMKSKRMRWARHVALMLIGEKKNVYRLLVGKPEG
jgi:hypothetical protein